MSNVTITTPSDLEIVITRVFNAPRPLVFEAMSNPEFLKRWLLGPPGWSMTQCDDDPRRKHATQRLPQAWNTESMRATTVWPNCCRLNLRRRRGNENNGLRTTET